MPLYVYQRPGKPTYYIRGKVQHLAIDRSAKTRSRGEAEALKAKWEAELFKRAVYGDRAVATFDEAVAVYIKAGGSPDHLDPIMDRIGHRRLGDVTQTLVDDLAAELKPQGIAATRIRHVYTPVLAVMNQAASAGLCDPIKLKKPKVKSVRTEYLTPQQAEDWIAALPPHLARLMSFYLGTGCRASEALNLPWKDITLGERRAVFWDTKEDYARGADLPVRVRELLTARGEPESVVFANLKGDAWHGYDSINNALKKVRARRAKAIKAGSNLPKLAPAHCHLFRHTWATWTYAVTRDLTRLMGQGGWRSASMVMRYTHVASPDLADAVKAAGWVEYGKAGNRHRKAQR